jgi:hypothetical protein
MSDTDDPTPVPPPVVAPAPREPKTLVAYMRKDGDSWVEDKELPPDVTVLLDGLDVGHTVGVTSLVGEVVEWKRSADSMLLLFDLADAVRSHLGRVNDTVLLTAIVNLTDHVADLHNLWNES